MQANAVVAIQAMQTKTEGVDRTAKETSEPEQNGISFFDLLHKKAKTPTDGAGEVEIIDEEILSEQPQEGKKDVLLKKTQKSHTKNEPMLVQLQKDTDSEHEVTHADMQVLAGEYQQDIKQVTLVIEIEADKPQDEPVAMTQVASFQKNIGENFAKASAKAEKKDTELKTVKKASTDTGHVLHDVVKDMERLPTEQSIQQSPKKTLVMRDFRHQLAHTKAVEGEAVREVHKDSRETLFTQRNVNPLSEGSKMNVSEKTQTAPSFKTALSEQIQSNMANIVQSGRIILRNDNSGAIKLHLKPEHLGAVKIDLELADGKKVLGTITVASQEAYDAFKDNLADLAQSFKQDGFESASFDLNWFNDGRQTAREDGENMAFSQYSAHQIVKSESKTADTELYAFGQAEAINLFA